MNKRKTQIAIGEALRFIQAAEKTLNGFVECRATNGVRYEDYRGSTKLTAAAKRASLDLTRALAAMRRPGDE